MRTTGTTIFLLACLMCWQGAMAQNGMILYPMADLPQRNKLNPALPYYGKGAVSIPFISSPHVALSNSAFAYSDFIRSDGDSLYMDPGNIVGKMDDRNLLHAVAETNVFGFSLKLGPGSFSFEVTEKASLFLSYSKEMMEFIWKGNAASLGETTELELDLDFTHRRDYALGYALRVNRDLFLGARLKYIYGMENAHAGRAYASLETDANTFALTATTSVAIHTSGLESNTFDEFDMNEYLWERDNKGWGVDFGFQYFVSDRLGISASVLDIGKINWRSHVLSYEGITSDGEFTYAGVDVEDFFAGNNGASDVFEEVLDSLESAFDITENENAYQTSLPTQAYFGVSYAANPGNTFHVLAHTVRFDDRTYADFSLSYTKRLGKWFSISPGLTLLNGNLNPGLGAVLSLGSFQFYLVSDNLPGVVYPQRSRNIDARAGINFVVGRGS